MGIPLMRTKTWAYAGGAFFGGVAGAYYASAKDSVTSDDFFFNISVFVLCMVILGGMGNVWGVLAGAAFLAYLNKEGLANIGAWINAHIHVVRLPAEHRRAALRDGDLRGDHRGRDALATRGPAAVEAPRRASCTRPRRTTRRSTTSSTRGRDGGGQHPRRRGPAQGVRRPRRGERRRLRRPARQGRLADRAERRREDDVLQHADRRLQADLRDG